MESLPQVGLATLTIICAVLCVGGILIGGILLLLVRSGIFGGFLEGLGGALRGDEEVGGGDTFQEGSLAYYEERRSKRKRRYRDVSDIRAEYDRQFDAQSGTGAPASETIFGDDEDRAHKRRFKRRFREENPDLDDEMDFYFDDTEL